MSWFTRRHARGVRMAMRAAAPRLRRISRVRTHGPGVWAGANYRRLLSPGLTLSWLSITPFERPVVPPV